MIEFIFGLCGAMLVVLTFVGGTVFGYWLRRVKAVKPVETVMAEEVEKERKRAAEDNEAFSNMMGYDIMQAYGIRRAEE